MNYGDSGKDLLKQAYAVDAVPATAPGWGGGNFGDSVTATAVTATAVPAAALPTSSYEVPMSMSSYSAYSQSSGGVDAAFFQAYAECVDRIESLSNAENNLNSVRQEISATESQINTLERKLAKARKDQPKLEARIQRNENPRFLHYMQFNRHEKVEKLKKDLYNMKQAQEKWTGERDQAKQNLQRLVQQRDDCKNSVETKQRLQQNRQEMYERAVTSVSPTPRLQQIDSNISAQNAALRSEQALLAQVDQVIGMVRQAQNMYRQSLQMLQRAAGANQTAQFVNVLDAGRGPDFFETMNQYERDRLINESQRPAMEAYVLIERAWATFPAEARNRYPTFAAQIGRTPMPRLQGANFGKTVLVGAAFGDIGDFANNMRSSSKIRENMAVLQQSNQIVDAQLQLVIALRGAIASNVAGMESQLQTLQGQRKEERDNIFKSVRARALGQQQQTWAVPSTNPVAVSASVNYSTSSATAFAVPATATATATATAYTGSSTQWGSQWG